MTVAIFGHRGYPARFPENSLQGFEYACEHCASMGLRPTFR